MSEHHGAFRHRCSDIKKISRRDQYHWRQKWEFWSSHTQGWQQRNAIRVYKFSNQSILSWYWVGFVGFVAQLLRLLLLKKKKMYHELNLAWFQLFSKEIDPRTTIYSLFRNFGAFWWLTPIAWKVYHITCGVVPTKKGNFKKVTAT